LELPVYGITPDSYGGDVATSFKSVYTVYGASIRFPLNSTPSSDDFTVKGGTVVDGDVFSVTSKLIYLLSGFFTFAASFCCFLSNFSSALSFLSSSFSYLALA